VHLSQIFTHPVKSMRGLQFSHAQVTPSGLAFDRIFMLTETDGRFITARQHPQLVLFTPTLLSNGIVITAPDNQSVTVTFADFQTIKQPTEVWGNHFTAHLAADSVNDWFSQYFNRPVQLRWLGTELTRRIKHFPDMPLSFADGYPFLLVNEASFELLQERCPVPLELIQFRPNLVVDHVPAFAEDSWKTIKIGEIIFDVVKPCTRCILTTVNPETGKKSRLEEPLTSLQQFRSKENGDIDFGMNLIARNHGVIRTHDKVEVLETRAPIQYITKSSNKIAAVTLEEEKPVIIDFQDATFTGNNQQVILEQLEQQGIPIKYSCRAGICGLCRIRLESGEVTPLRKGAIKNNGMILACSCIPKSNIRLKKYDG